MDNFEIIQSKIDAFVSKYYKGLLIRGIVYFITISIICITLFSTIEYFGWLSTQIRFIIFWFTVVSLLFVTVVFLLIPLLRLFGVAKKITNVHAAKIIQNNVTGIDDELINTIEIKQLSDNSDSDLLRASLQQKSINLKDKNFSNAVKFYSPKYIYAISLVIVFLLSFLVKPEVYTKATKRIINYNQYYDKYEDVKIYFYDSLVCERNTNYLLKISITGNVNTNNLFVRIGSADFLMEKLSDSVFQYQLKNINNNFSFYFYNDEYRSSIYNFNIIDAPTLKNLKAYLIYPEYTKLQSEELTDIYEFSVPQGTQIQWNINSLFTDYLYFIIDSSRVNFSKSDNNFNFDSVFTESFKYSLYSFNKDFRKDFFINKYVEIIPDVYPTIEVKSLIDKDNFALHHFQIIITDDYGFYNLKFYGTTDTINIPFNKNIERQEVFFSYDFSNFNDSVYSYYFQVWDNDNLNSFKATKSIFKKFVKPSLNSVVKEDLNRSKDIEKEFNKALEKSEELQSEIDKLKKDLLNKNLADWEKKQRIDELNKKQNEIEQLIDNLQNLNKEKNNFNQSFSEVDESLVDKQKQLEESIENLMTDELRELFKQLEEMKKEFDQGELNKLMDKLDFNYENIEKELDKNLELLNRFKIEQNIDNISEQLKKLSEEAKELSEESKSDKLDKDDFNDKLDNHKKEFEELSENFDELKRQNKDLEKPFDLDQFSPEMDNIQKNNEQMNNENSESKDEMSDKLQDNSDKMKELSEEMSSMMNSQNAEQEQENADDLRQLLENIFYISFEQEKIFDEIKYVSSRNPRYVDLQHAQLKLENDFSIVRDSLFALSKRTAFLQNHISNHTFKIQEGLILVNTQIAEHKTSNVLRTQQEVMMNINELLLLLTESLKNMDQAASGSGGGQQQKSKRKQKPKKGDSLGDIKGGQESLKSQLEQMLKEMKNGQKPGGKEQGSQLGQMLAKQEIYQQMLNQLMNNGNIGSGAQKQLKEIQRLMEQTKRDIVNMNISRSTINRQQQIVTRLLEAENAEMEREIDKKRESKEAKNYNVRDINKYFEEYNENIKFREILNYKDLKLNSYYKNLYDTYLLKVNTEKNE